jgi:hypothetical protein
MKIIFNNVEKNIDEIKIIEGLNVLADHAETMPGTDGVMIIDGVTYNVGGTAYTTPKAAITAGLENYKTNPSTFASVVSSIDNAIIAYVVEEEPTVAYSVGLAFTDNGDGTCYVSGIGECTDTDVNIPPVSPDGSSVTGIGTKAFLRCNQLTSIIIPDGVTTIGQSAFSGCSLASVTIPNSVKSISYGAFFVCPLIDVYYSGTKTEWNAISIDTSDDANKYLLMATIHYNGGDDIPYSVGFKFTDNGDGTCSLAGIGSCTDTILFIPPTSPDGNIVTSIASFALMMNSKITDIILPNSITSIGSNAFFSCSVLRNVTIPTSTVSIGANAFQSCNTLAVGNVYYAGSEEQWNAVSIDGGNDPLTNATIHYNYVA